MAQFTITISNNLTLIGPAPANQWGAFDWGENWGSDKDLELQPSKWLSESLTLNDSLSKQPSISISNSLSVTSAMNLVALQDGSGYSYIEKGELDPDDRIFQEYTEQSGSTPTYTEQSASDPGWSDA